MRQIVCLSNEPWSHIPGRTQQLISRIPDTSILYFFPSWRGGQGRLVRPNVMTYPIPPLGSSLQRRHPALLALAQRKALRIISSKLVRHRFSRPLFWATCPAHVHLLSSLDGHAWVYDCDRIWEEHPPSWEGELAAASEVVFVASPDLQDRLSPCSANLVLLPHGVSYPLFQRNAPLPAAPSGTPTFGWAGTIHQDLILEPLLYAAKAHPEWTFYLLGQQQNHPLLSQLQKIPQVMLLPPCPIHQLPAYLQSCHVLLNFLRASQPYWDIIPSRIYEYLSTGLPIVSMLWPDQVEPFPDVIYCASSSKEFLTLCEHALEEDPRWVSQRRQQHAARASWTLRAKEVACILEAAGLLPS